MSPNRVPYKYWEERHVSTNPRRTKTKEQRAALRRGIHHRERQRARREIERWLAEMEASGGN